MYGRGYAARDIATRLDGYNKERQQIESSVLNEALQIASKSRQVH